MLWSILIAAIPERYHVVQPLLLSLLEHQAVARIPEVELLYLMDNRRRAVGAKRNALLAMATGEYVSFIDDDDRVAPDYVSRIQRAIAQTRKDEAGPADVICFKQLATLKQHGVVHECSYSLEHFKREPRRALAQILGPNGTPDTQRLAWTGPPAHTMVWRRELVAGIPFPEQQFGEDTAWVDAACELAKRELRLDATLYYYDFDEEVSATR